MIDSARDLAYQLNDRLKLGLTPRPWNLYAPGDTFWWLVGTGCSQFSDTVTKASSSADLYMYVTAGYVHDRESEARVQHDSVMFKCTPSGLTPLLRNLPVHVLDGADRATSFTALADTLRGVDDYHWVDLYVGTHVSKGDVDLLDLHGRVLSYFDAWLK